MESSPQAGGGGRRRRRRRRKTLEAVERCCKLPRAAAPGRPCTPPPSPRQGMMSSSAECWIEDGGVCSAGKVGRELSAMLLPLPPLPLLPPHHHTFDLYQQQQQQPASYKQVTAGPPSYIIYTTYPLHRRRRRRRRPPLASLLSRAPSKRSA